MGGTRGLVGVVGWIVIVAVSLLVVVSSGGIVAANHGAEGANFTVEPLDDRRPGASDVTYGQIVVGEAGIDLEVMERTVGIYREGSWSACGPASAEVFGIDRGNTQSGYEIDETLQEHVKRFSAGDDRLETEYYQEDDFGASTYFNDGDAFVSVAECIENPAEPGWYQITGTTTGVRSDGERVSFSGESHYFWICECEDEAAAREQLGPPPSAPRATATPEPTPTPHQSASGTSAMPETAGTATAQESSAGERTATGLPSGQRQDTAVDGSSTPAPARGVTPSASERQGTGVTPTENPERWEAVIVRTPTPGDGSGVGVICAGGALLVAASLIRRWH